MNGPELVFTMAALLLELVLFSNDLRAGTFLFGLDVSIDNFEDLFRASRLSGFTSGCKDIFELFSVHNDKQVMRHVESIWVTKTGSSLIS